MSTIIVMFNDADPADSLAFPSWGKLRKYLVDKICSDIEWRTKAWHIYHSKREWVEFNTDVVSDFCSFEEWYADISYPSIIDLVSYFGYFTIEEIDYND